MTCRSRTHSTLVGCPCQRLRTLGTDNNGAEKYSNACGRVEFELRACQMSPGVKAYACRIRRGARPTHSFYHTQQGSSPSLLCDVQVFIASQTRISAVISLEEIRLVTCEYSVPSLIEFYYYLRLPSFQHALSLLLHLTDNRHHAQRRLASMHGRARSSARRMVARRSERDNRRAREHRPPPSGRGFRPGPDLSQCSPRALSQKPVALTEPSRAFYSGLC